MNEKQLIKLLTEGDKVSAGFKAVEDDPSLVRGDGTHYRKVGMIRELVMGCGGRITEKTFFAPADVHAFDGQVRIDFNPEIETITDDQGRERHAVTLLEKDSEGFGVKFASIRDTVRDM